METERAPALPPDENSRHDLFLRAVAPAPASAPVPRALLVFAHQDDEAVALGARLENFGSAHIVHVTDGAPRNEQDSSRHGLTLAEYRKARENELAVMLNAAGLGNVSRECLRVPDQEARLTLVALTRTIDRIIRQRRPEVIFTHPYEGGHPDHDACAFAVQHAVELRPESQCPLIIEGTFYHAGPRGFQAGSFPPPPHPVPEAEFRLTADEHRRKQALLDLFTTQRQTLSGFRLEYERFRIAPHYDFCNPPHTPPVLYDSYPWGMTSREFVQLACEAEATLSKPVLAAACH